MKAKHLNLSDRNDIQSLLNQNKSFSYIGNIIHKDRTTISKEVKKHRVLTLPSSFNNSSRNHCKFASSCTKSGVCNSACKLACSSCSHCNSHCESFSLDLCERLLKPPYVCNGCSKRRHCRKVKYLYKSQTANNEYLDLLRSSRIGLNSTPDEFKHIDDTVSSLLKQGHSPYAIISNNPHLNISVSYIYRNIKKGLFTANLFDMPRILKFKPRKQNFNKREYEPGYALNRSYTDFLDYISLFPNSDVVEMDCVEGTKNDDKVLLTFYLRKANLLIIKVLDEHTNKAVVHALDELENEIGSTRFKRYFSIILTDRGKEFKNHKAIEYNKFGKKRTSLYFCDPGASFQKGLIEERHVLIRKVIPKGTSLSRYTQSDVSLLFNNINNYPTFALNGITPMEKAKTVYPKLFLEKLNCISINNNTVILTKNLLKK